MNRYFSSDYHFSHANIINYCNRPFKTIEEMNETIIARHNSKVKKEDKVYFLGDFCFRNTAGGKKGEGTKTKPKYYLDQMNGEFTFIRGNHCNSNSLKTDILKMIIELQGKRICLVHNPEHADIGEDLVLAGHVHRRYKFNTLKKGNNFVDVVNVGVDVWNFYPVNFDEIMRDYRRWKSGN